MNEPWSAENVKAKLVEVGVPETSPYFRDSRYCLLTWESLESVRATFRALLSGLRAQGFRTETWDCEDYVAVALLAFRIAWKETAGHPDAAAAVGSFDYMQLTGGMHGVVSGLFVRDGVVVHANLEPQQDLAVVELDPFEIMAAVHVDY